ncbi:MAG: hypothetical protein HXY36_00695, partial [Chloroflexi bacterium]|nr:hypothetical protein [Chloroflexota bacterium]
AMVVLPVGVAAQCDYDGVQPPTYAKIPFAIIQTGVMLLSNIVGALPPDMGIPGWIVDVLDEIAPWTGGPLAWTVDMLAWGLVLMGDVVGQLGPILDAAGIELPIDLADIAEIFDTIACDLFAPFVCNVTGANITPCD